MCPYLVGSYERVGEELGHYLSLGYQRFILDIPPNRRELEHMAAAFERACSRVTL
jgi:alkanesulfonate monooxygenase